MAQPKIRIIVCLTERQLQYLREASAAHEISRAEYVRRIIDADIDRTQGRRGK